jgi:hypothetical protein
MVDITLKANHFYFITYYLKNGTIDQYFSLISRIKTALAGNTDLDLSFTISASADEVITMFRMLTILPEGQANKINTEMDDLLLPQIALGVADEQANSIEGDWHYIAANITETKTNNTAARDNAIQLGKTLIDQI